MSSNLSTVIQSITNTSRLVRNRYARCAGHLPNIMGNPPKITEWRLMETSEANHQDRRDPIPRPAVLGSCGKTGKNGRKERKLLCHPGGAACSLLPGESPTFVSQWSNGKGRFRKRPFFYIGWWDRWKSIFRGATSHTPVHLLPFLWDRVKPGSSSLIPGK